MNRRGEMEWCPEKITSEVNLGHVDEDQRFLCTVESTARVLRFLREGKLSEESFVDGLSKNAKHLGISEELLLDLAHNQILEQESTESTAA